jgi:hypothetical protein
MINLKSLNKFVPTTGWDKRFVDSDLSRSATDAAIPGYFYKAFLFPKAFYKLCSFYDNPYIAWKHIKLAQTKFLNIIETILKIPWIQS